jgi:hypothetical protein
MRDRAEWDRDDGGIGIGIGSGTGSGESFEQLQRPKWIRNAEGYRASR